MLPMTKPEEGKREGATTYSALFGPALSRVMIRRDVKQSAVARKISRSPGYVSVHLVGKGPVDTDMIIAVAALAEIRPDQVIAEVLEEMGELPDNDTLLSPVEASSIRRQARGAGRRPRSHPDPED